MKGRIIALFFLVCGTVNAQQEQGKSYNMFWFGYYNYTQLNSKWSVNTDIQHRTRDGFEIQSQSLIRTALAYKVNKLITVSAGGSHFRYFITNTLTRGEWRPHQELMATTEHGSLRIVNRLRVEERFNQIVSNEVATTDYKFIWRFRYKFDLEFPLLKKKHTLGVANEFMINAGKGIINPFDQNRSSVSFNYQLAENLKLQFQYMVIVQYQATKNSYDKVSVFRLNLHHTISYGGSANK